MKDGNTLGQLRAEMARLTTILMRKNAQYVAREEQLIHLHGDDNRNLMSIMNEDLLLRNYSGAAQTCARLAGALAQVIVAEITYRAAYGPLGQAASVSVGPEPPRKQHY